MFAFLTLLRFCVSVQLILLLCLYLYVRLLYDCIFNSRMCFVFALIFDLHSICLCFAFVFDMDLILLFCAFMFCVHLFYSYQLCSRAFIFKSLRLHLRFDFSCKLNLSFFVFLLSLRLCFAFYV